MITIFKVAQIILVTFPLTAFAAPSVNCSNDALTKKAIYDLPGSGYWMQSAGDCRLTYTANGGIHSYLYNMCTRKSETITHYIDAFPVPGTKGDLYVHPHLGISFYKMKDSLASTDPNQNDVHAIYSDPKHIGNYESLGLLPGSTDSEKVIRVAQGNSAGAIRDYKMKKSGDDYSFEPVEPQVTPVCNNLVSNQGNKGLTTEIPILSRDGQMIAGREFDSQKTGIYKIKMPSGDCQKIKEVPSETDKVSFTFDNKKILYTVSDPDSGFQRLMEMDIASGKERTLSGPDENVEYMTPKEDGTILYTRHIGMNRATGGSDTSELVALDPQTVDDPTPAKAKVYEAIGVAWATACNKPVDLDYALAVGQRLDKANCASLLIPDNTGGLPDELRSVSVDQMKTACNSNATNAGGAGNQGTN